MQKIKKIVDFVLGYGIIAWVASAVVWFFIVNTIHDGISCDEGYYLMGFLREQNIEGQGWSDFHSIVRALCLAFPDDNIMIYRYMRLVLNVIALAVFAPTSYRWLVQRHGFSVSRWAYYPMVALAGAMSFTFAAPTISYDNLEVIISLLSFSLFFVQFTSSKRWISFVSAFGIGFLQWFAFTNYPPAGLCLTLLLIVLYFLETGWNAWWVSLGGYILGLVLAMTVNHIFVHDLRLWGADFVNMFVSTFTETSMSRHDSGSLVSGMLMTVGKQALIMIPIAALATLFYSKIRMREWLLWLLAIGICIFLLAYRGVYELRGALMLIPVAIMLGKVIDSKLRIKISGLRNYQFLFVLLVLIAIPFAGVFGTNQAIMRKAIIFTPFWLLAYFFLATQINGKVTYRLNLVFMTILFAGYIYLGNFQRYQYYYTPRASKYELAGVSRAQNIRVSQYQQAYYSDLLDSLRAAGCKPGDRYMAFEEDLMAVYLAGGHIEGRLTYHWWQYKKMDGEAPDAFILFKKEENAVIKHFATADWDFPNDYRRIEMRQAAENMEDALRTVLYVKKDKDNNEQ